MPAERRRTAVAKLAGAALVLLLVLWARTGCGALDVEAPQGFARLGETGMPHRSLSPDGVVFRVRVEPHEPRADLAFWREAMRRHLLGAGYRLVEEGEAAAAGSARGYRIELAAPYGGEDFRYLVALFVTDDDLLVVEASGEAARFDGRRAEILDAIARIEGSVVTRIVPRVALQIATLVALCGALAPGQVGIQVAGVDRVTVTQIPEPGTRPRSFDIGVDG